MSDNYSLIIKNGSCYIDGKLIKFDIGLYENKIKKIGNIEENNSKVYDATGKVVCQESLTPKYILENLDLPMQKI